MSTEERLRLIITLRRPTGEFVLTASLGVVQVVLMVGVETIKRVERETAGGGSSVIRRGPRYPLLHRVKLGVDWGADHLVATRATQISETIDTAKWRNTASFYEGLISGTGYNEMKGAIDTLCDEIDRLSAEVVRRDEEIASLNRTDSERFNKLDEITDAARE